MDAVIFDFDGVIADTDSFYIKYLKNYFAKLGVIVGDEDIVHLTGFTFSKRLDYINEKYGTNVTKEDFKEDTYEKMNQEMRGKVEIKEGLLDLLQEIKENNIKIGIASSNSTKNILFYLEKFGIRDLFSEIVAIEDIEHVKPAPEVYEKAVQYLNKKPGKCVAIEDTSVGIESAFKAGLKTVAIPNKFTLSHDFSKADLIVKSFNELSFEKLEDLVK
ncbi:HAD family phosphatase [archaeon]|nr:HAD family phosphatase [archaeon]